MESHEYLMECRKFFSGNERFQVVASSKDEAMILGEQYIRRDSNFIKESLRVVRKMKPSFGK